MTKPKRSTVIRLLESRHIPYQISTYATDICSTEEVAHVLGIPAHEVYKTLVDQAAQALMAFVVSAEQREKNLRQRPDDFVAMTHARFVAASIDRDAMP